jgi:hypothetical protein
LGRIAFYNIQAFALIDSILPYKWTAKLLAG